LVCLKDLTTTAARVSASPPVRRGGGMMEPISTLGVKGLKTLASKAWKHLRDTSSDALIKKGLDQVGQTMHCAWLDACEHWLDQLEADNLALFYMAAHI
jgi:hypothetical protein